jgi:hypothetical protein
MRELFITDFIKNKIIQAVVLAGITLDLLLAQTIRHILIMFCLPYGVSIILNYLMKQPAPRRPQARISEQYRVPVAMDSKIKIIPK